MLVEMLWERNKCFEDGGIYLGAETGSTFGNGEIAMSKDRGDEAQRRDKREELHGDRYSKKLKIVDAE